MKIIKYTTPSKFSKVNDINIVIVHSKMLLNLFNSLILFAILKAIIAYATIFKSLLLLIFIKKNPLGNDACNLLIAVIFSRYYDGVHG